MNFKLNSPILMTSEPAVRRARASNSSRRYTSRGRVTGEKSRRKKHVCSLFLLPFILPIVRDMDVTGSSILHKSNFGASLLHCQAAPQLHAHMFLLMDQHPLWLSHTVRTHVCLRVLAERRLTFSFTSQTQLNSVVLRCFFTQEEVVAVGLKSPLYHLGERRELHPQSPRSASARWFLRTVTHSFLNNTYQGTEFI